VEGCGRESYNQASFWHSRGDWRWSAKQVMFFINPIKELERK